MIALRAQILTAEAFAPFGTVTEHPSLGDRFYMDTQLTNRRPIAAKASLSIAHYDARHERPLPLTVIERHEFSSQSFMPLSAGRYLTVVAPKNADGTANLVALSAFVAESQSITYKADVWHGPMTPLDGPMRFAIFMFNDGVSGDEEVIRHEQPFAMLMI